MQPVFLAPKIRPLSFSADGLGLSGWLHRPDRDRFPVVVGCHGLQSDASSPKQQALAEACGRRGIGYLRFDHRGCGRSQGAFAAVTTLAGRVADLLAAVAAARRQPGADGRIGLFGSSLGAAVCIAAAPRLKPSVLVLYAAPLASRGISAAVQNLPSFADGSGLDFDLRDALPSLRNVLVIHGTDDSVVPVDNARDIFAGAGAPKRLWLQSGGDHPMSDPIHQARFTTEAAAWFAEGFGSGRDDLDP